MKNITRGNKITEKPKNERNSGLEIPCNYIIKGPNFMIRNVGALISEYIAGIKVIKYKMK